MRQSEVAQLLSDSLQPHGLKRTMLLRPWDFPGKSTGVGCHFLLQSIFLIRDRTQVSHIVGRRFTIWATRTCGSFNLFIEGIPWRSQWLGLHASTTGGTSLIPGWGTKILQATWCDQTKKRVFTECGLREVFSAFYSPFSYYNCVWFEHDPLSVAQFSKAWN